MNGPHLDEQVHHIREFMFDWVVERLPAQDPSDSEMWRHIAPYPTVWQGGEFTLNRGKYNTFGPTDWNVWLEVIRVGDEWEVAVLAAPHDQWEVQVASVVDGMCTRVPVGSCEPDRAWGIWDRLQRDNFGRPSIIGAHLAGVSSHVREFASALEDRLESIDDDFDRGRIAPDDRDSHRQIIEDAINQVRQAADEVRSAERLIVSVFPT